ncbi:MAG: ATP-grasp domain-containing protein [Chloroflexi bacterium]|nr:ATP-grasp domain-containing protein [Chloroflexota bacterium]
MPKEKETETRVGLSYDLKEAISLNHHSPEDTLEEYDSVETVEIIKASLEIMGHSVNMLGGGREFLANILVNDVNIVFNIAEGRGNYRSREAQVPAILEMLDIPYSGSDPQCLAVSLDKSLTKKLVAQAGVITPAWRTVSNNLELAKLDWGNFPFPAIVKPACEGSSKGVRLTSLVDNPVQAKAAVDQILTDYSQPAIVEEFINGDEVTVGMVGNYPPRIVGVMRVIPRQKQKFFLYSLEVKRDWQKLVDYECPAKFSEDTTTQIMASSLKTFEILGCRDFARIDFRVAADGTPYFIEINPLPGLGTYSDLVIMALKLGWTHQALIQAVFNAALERYPSCQCA